MAAGEGRRLRPLTDRYAKPVLPIDGRPVVVGVPPGAASRRHRAHDRRHGACWPSRWRRCSPAFPAELRFVHQPRAEGSADAVRRCRPRSALPRPRGRHRLQPRRRRPLGCAAAEGFDGAVAVRRRPPPGPGRSAVGVEDGLVTRVLDDDPENPLAVRAALALRRSRPRPSRRPARPAVRERDAPSSVRSTEGARVAGIEIGPTRDLTDPFDLVEENFGYLRGL